MIVMELRGGQRVMDVETASLSCQNVNSLSYRYLKGDIPGMPCF